MPSVHWNEEEWSERYEWPAGGDEWSTGWGGPAAQWLTTVWPRLSPFLPTESVLEIAPGFGRWTEFLLPLCNSYVGVDLSPRCIDACGERFRDYSKARFFTNNGMSLDSVPDASISLVFSFDALVHVEMTEISGYLKEMARVLSPNGVAVIHHSNLGALRGSLFLRRAFDVAARRIPGLSLGRHRLFGWDQNRAMSVSADSVRIGCEAAQLSCIGQEVVVWHSGRHLLDCISIMTRQGSVWDRPLVSRTNRNFMRAAESSRVVSDTFLSLSDGSSVGHKLAGERWVRQTAS